MRPTRLFPDDEFSIRPVVHRTGPPLWVRRLVIANAGGPKTEVLRDITFRPGLNVIRAADRPAGETRPVGHSVGKTLLARLLRYSLGERHFAEESVLGHIETEFPGVRVLAEVVVHETNWVVSRPLADRPPGESFATRADEWTAGLRDAGEQQPFDDFQEALKAATLDRLPPLTLPSTGRTARWIDLLAWLTRDQECRFGHYNEWRDPDANSGTARLHRDDASRLLAWVMGLLDEDDDVRSVARAATRDRLNEAKLDYQHRAASLAHKKNRLVSELSLTAEDLDDDLSVQQAKELTKGWIGKLEGLLSEFEEDADAARIWAEVVGLAEEFGGVRRDLDREFGSLREAQGELASVRESSTEVFNRKFAPPSSCPKRLPDCSLYTPPATEGARDPYRETRIVELGAIVAARQAVVARLEAQLDELREARQEATGRHTEAAKRRDEKLAGASSTLGHWRGLKAEVDRYDDERRGLTRAENVVKNLERQVDESLGRQDSARKQQKRKRDELSRYFVWALKELFGPDADGKLAFDAKGLRPVPMPTLGANGAAVSTVSRVLGFDLACLAASTCGVGHAPPFLIHDSPKEADMEDALYDRLFELPLELERAYRGQTPLFQYIVTTTSPPPDPASAEPYTRLVLDARVPEGLLLGRQF